MIADVSRGIDMIFDNFCYYSEVYKNSYSLDVSRCISQSLSQTLTVSCRSTHDIGIPTAFHIYTIQHRYLLRMHQKSIDDHAVGLLGPARKADSTLLFWTLIHNWSCWSRIDQS